MSGGDTLSRVALSHSAVNRWHAKAGELAREARKHGVRKPADIPDELAVPGRSRTMNAQTYTIDYHSGIQSRREAVSHMAALREEWDDAGTVTGEHPEVEQTWSGGGWDYMVTDAGGHSVYFKEVTPH